jgi:hypothetical protein
MKNLKIAVALVSVFTFSSCNNDDPIAINQEEVITTVTTTLTAGSQTVTMTSRDLDGDGPNVPVVTVSGDLLVNTTYSGAVTLNESVTPVDDITVEVKKKVWNINCFSGSKQLSLYLWMQMLTVNQLDWLYFKNRCSSCGNSIVVILRHEPLKVLLVLHPVQSQMQVEQQMHRLPMQFRLNSILVQK